MSFKNQLNLNRNRHHTTLKNQRNMKSVSRAKMLDCKVNIEFWKHEEQQELTLFQYLIIFASQSLAVLCVKRPWNFSSSFQWRWSFFGIQFFQTVDVYQYSEEKTWVADQMNCSLKKSCKHPYLKKSTNLLLIRNYWWNLKKILPLPNFQAGR